MSNATSYESSPATSSELPSPELDVRINVRLFIVDGVLRRLRRPARRAPFRDPTANRSLGSDMTKRWMAKRSEHSAMTSATPPMFLSSTFLFAPRFGVDCGQRCPGTSGTPDSQPGTLNKISDPIGRTIIQPQPPRSNARPCTQRQKQLTRRTPPFTESRRTALILPNRATRGSVCNGLLASRLWNKRTKEATNGT